MSELTFAEAMALDPSEVEFCYAPGPNGQNWSPLEAGMDQSLHGMRHAKFRRAKPKRSRVQEMAERFYADTPAGALLADYAAIAMKETIRAVCEWQREQWAECKSAHVIGPAAIEREFLVPR